MIWDWIVCFLLFCGVLSGMYTMQVHHNYFSEFTIRDLIRGRRDGLLYLWNTSSTAWCLIDCVARFVWRIDVGWNSFEGGTKWQLIWLFLHGVGACTAILGHWAVHISLRNECCRNDLSKRNLLRGR